jgi:hypothetical protein
MASGKGVEGSAAGEGTAAMSDRDIRMEETEGCGCDGRDPLCRKDSSISRRQFFGRVGKIGGAVVMGSLAGRAFAGDWEQGSSEWWTGETFHQDSMDPSGEAGGIVRGRIGGEWKEFRTISLPQSFLDWNFRARLEVLESIGSMMRGGGGSGPSLAGPHNAAMATWGGMRLDSQLSVNNAFKGIGLCPVRDRIGGFIQHMSDTIDGPMPEKLGFLSSLYSDPSNFDVTKVVSLELYAVPTFETHTFLNLMENPSTSLVFLDVKSFEVRGLAELVHPADTEAPSYSRDILTYTNLAHSYFHGAFPRLFPAIIVHVVEVFDNSPGEGLGVRVAPALT